MDKIFLQEMLARVAQGGLAPEQAADMLASRLGVSTVEDAINGLALDTQRQWRTGLGEVVFAQGKSDAALLAAVEGLAAHGPVLVSRVDRGQQALLTKHFALGLSIPHARLFALGAPDSLASRLSPPYPTHGQALVVTAGAADMGIALEAYGTLCFFGMDCGCIPDVGVAGLHRLSPHLQAMQEARVIIAVAGMEGALPGVLAGLVHTPILAVPTSVGYGVGAGGFAALSTMLCACAPGLAVLNIDNGFGAATFAAKLLMRLTERG